MKSKRIKLFSGGESWLLEFWQRFLCQLLLTLLSRQILLEAQARQAKSVHSRQLHSGDILNQLFGESS